MTKIPYKQILSFWFITSVAVLVVNDFYLKSSFPGFITGKLSDFAGLFAFPLFFSLLLPKKKNWIYAFAAIIFILWKLPASDHFISFWNQNMPYSIGRVVDYTDYLALLIIPISYFYAPEKTLKLSESTKKLAAFAIASLAVFSFLATAGTHGNIGTYRLEYSKSEVSQAIHALHQKYPEYSVPKQFEKYTWHYGERNSTDQWIQQANADSVTFHFFSEEENIIFWISFSGRADNWNEPQCQLSLIGFIKADYEWTLKDDLLKGENQNAIYFFEEEILTKLDGLLKNEIPIE